ncbi:MAG: response regulator [Elusimicrobiales bacterium]|nr:response regulator [Elusimicrobiales bacterium]
MNAAHGGLDILLVDDNEDDLLMARKVFSRLPFAHRLTTASCAAEALDYLRRSGGHAGRKGGQPHLILLDINMPGMDGFGLLRLLKADPELRKVPVIMLTTSASRDDVRKSYECGAASFITKPETFEGFSGLMKQFAGYWLSVSALPQPGE